MGYRETSARVAAYRQEIADIRKRMQQLQQTIEPEPVADYEFEGAHRPVTLSALFGARRELFVIHSMGIHCAYCTSWADGYNGVYAQLAQRAAFVIAGPDAPALQQDFAGQRGWRFPLVSHRGNTFASDMGYRSARGALLPGLSVFRKGEHGITRIADAAARPGDDFSPLCRLLEFLPGGWEGFSLPDESLP